MEELKQTRVLYWSILSPQNARICDDGFGFLLRLRPKAIVSVRASMLNQSACQCFFFLLLVDIFEKIYISTLDLKPKKKM